MAEAASSTVSVAEASLLIKSIDDLTQCAICQETLSQPKLLPCFHTFCLDCLRKSFEDRQPGAEVSCPVCRGTVAVPDDGFEALPPHFFVENLLDAKKISKQLTMQQRCDICCDDDDGDGDGGGDDEAEKPFATSYCGECGQFLCSRCSKYDMLLCMHLQGSTYHQYHHRYHHYHHHV